MPKRTDINSILIVGAGPIIIGQACEFDYSGTQACKALKEEGYRVILVNSNPATIMTDPELADATYIEPITPEVVAKIIAKERPDAILPTMGGQTALNTALSLRRMGVLDRYGVEMIGADAEAIDKAEDRSLFREAMAKIGLETPRSMLANASDVKDADKQRLDTQRAALRAQQPADLDAKLDALETDWNLAEGDRKARYVAHAMGVAAQALDFVGLPAIIRPSFTMGGTGGGIAYNRQEFFDIVQSGLDASPTTEVLIENGKITDARLSEIEKAFHETYEREYTYRLDAPVEMVGIHLVASAEVGKLTMKKREGSGAKAETALKGHRDVDYALEGVKKAAIYDGTKLEPGMTFKGPAIVEDPGTTVVIHPGNAVEIDGYGNIHIQIA